MRFFLNDDFLLAIASKEGKKRQTTRMLKYALRTKNGIRNIAYQIILIMKGKDEKQKKLVERFFKEALPAACYRKLCLVIKNHPDFAKLLKEKKIKITAGSWAAAILGVVQEEAYRVGK